MQRLEGVDVQRDPRRLKIPVADWSRLSAEERTYHLDLVDREIEEIGIVVLARALPAERCDHSVLQL